MTTRVKLRKIIRESHLGPCYEWTGATFQKTGYGKRMYKGRVWLAHRATWDEEVGPIPDGLCVLHRCDNPPCVRRKHLFLGTKKDNSDDMIVKGRQKILVGRDNGRSKLTDEQVAEIRRRYTGTKRGNPNFVSQAQLAREYGVCQAHISKILLEVSWKES